MSTTPRDTQLAYSTARYNERHIIHPVSALEDREDTILTRYDMRNYFMESTAVFLFPKSSRRSEFGKAGFMALCQLVKLLISFISLSAKKERERRNT